MCFRAKMEVTSTLWSEIKSPTNQSSDSGSNGPKEAQTPKLTCLGQDLALGTRTRRPMTSQPQQLGAVGATGWPVDHPCRCWYFLTLIEESASARKYRCSTSPGSIQGIVFSMRNGCVTVFYLDYPEEDKR